MIRLEVCRLSGHSGQDSQAYKPAEVVEGERARDPLTRLFSFLSYSESAAEKLKASIAEEVQSAYFAASSASEPTAESVYQHCYNEVGQEPLVKTTDRHNATKRINMVDAIRMTLAAEMRTDKRYLILGEDVATKGGVHTATLGLGDEFGDRRVVDTSLSEEGIIGTSVGMALAGLRPLPEIQFRKYADAGMEQLVNCGTLHWRTAGRCSAPLVVRMPFGVSRRAGDPWHSVCGESIWAHQVGWKIAIPSTTSDAVGLLRSAMRGADPVLFLEHRALLDAESARGSYPGDDYCLPFGVAAIRRSGGSCTVVTWGMMVERCLVAVENCGIDAEVIDLRTIEPWDKQTVCASIRKTGRILIVHEDYRTCGFGAEISASIAAEAFSYLDAPIARLAVEDIPIPYNAVLTSAAVPSVERIEAELRKLVEF